MKRLLLAGAALAVMVSAASAADIAARPYTKAVPYAAPIDNWTGFYVGGFVGGVFDGGTDTRSMVPGGAFGGERSSAFIGGGQVGINYQFSPNWLVGIEGDIGGGTKSDRVFTNPTPGPIFAAHASDWLGSVTGRLGYTWGPGLIYAKGGVAFRDRGSFDNIALPAFTVDSKTTGYTIGGGLEYMFAPAWSGKIEYQYYDFGRTAVNDATAPIETLSYRDHLHTVKVGVNYHFNWGGPVVAKY